jgi:type IX secretion system PorP/SprF family membrane protein
LSNPLLEFQPSVFIQSDAISTKIDVNATLMYNKKFWGGVSYRVGSAVVGMVGISILNGVRVGYAYDFDTSALTKFSSGSHEVMIGYSFTVGVEKTPQKYKSIRYL